MFSFAIGPSVSPGQDGSCEDGPRGHSHLATQLRARHVLQHPIRGQQASNKFSRHCIAIYQEWIFDSRHAKAKPLTKAGLDVSCLGEGETFVKVLHGYCLYPMQPKMQPPSPGLSDCRRLGSQGACATVEGTCCSHTSHSWTQSGGPRCPCSSWHQVLWPPFQAQTCAMGPRSTMTCRPGRLRLPGACLFRRSDVVQTPAATLGLVRTSAECVALHQSLLAATNADVCRTKGHWRAWKLAQRG